MISYGIINLSLAQDLIDSLNKYSTLEEILETIESMTSHSTTVMCYDEIYNQECSGEVFANWLYENKSHPELRDIKRELSIQLEKATPIEKETYDLYLHAIERLDVSYGLLMTICCNERNVLYVANLSRYWSAKQWYLARYVSKSDFIAEAMACFTNLYFHNNVSTSVNTLHGEFTVERPIIVQHLQALNDFKSQFGELSNAGVGYREMCKEFENKYAFECSPQADRGTTKHLHFSFANLQTSVDELLCCELHTKLKWHGMDKEHQDRIYFHPGKAGIEGGKVLIVHIGRHL